MSALSVASVLLVLDATSSFFNRTFAQVLSLASEPPTHRAPVFRGAREAACRHYNFSGVVDGRRGNIWERAVPLPRSTHGGFRGSNVRQQGGRAVEHESDLRVAPTWFCIRRRLPSLDRPSPPPCRFAPRLATLSTKAGIDDSPDRSLHRTERPEDFTFPSRNALVTKTSPLVPRLGPAWPPACQPLPQGAMPLARSRHGMDTAALAGAPRKGGGCPQMVLLAMDRLGHSTPWEGQPVSPALAPPLITFTRLSHYTDSHSPLTCVARQVASARGHSFGVDAKPHARMYHD